MKIQITYSFKSAYGFDITSRLIAESKDEAERYCRNIEKCDGYKLIDVTTIENS